MVLKGILTKEKEEEDWNHQLHNNQNHIILKQNGLIFY